ncbi:Imm32 family immunity protein [Acetivibrio clariflavus]|uniref:Uncharacterized protein n=1 Tax=Acetivibrio clariflavus (strain DSM 19732 / NBRC 101661 / EBR45) TaxID=720554 RepID=G8LV87_ACECE|nr:hypothetical protein [Acetivibrio clariflavus]AEV67441.1 hypothetical protein Clocl_0741 [Acetivibrio clariflavus DSM 19732]
MKLNIDIKNNKFELEDGAIIRVKDIGDEFVIEANPSGLISLAKHLLILASDKFESGDHIHYEAGMMLEEGSVNFVIEKI